MTNSYEKFNTDEELIERLARELPGVSRIKKFGNTTSVEYRHNMWRDEFTSVPQITKALQKAYMKN